MGVFFLEGFQDIRQLFIIVFLGVACRDGEFYVSGEQFGGFDYRSD